MWISSCREWESCLSVCCLLRVSLRYFASDPEIDLHILFSVKYLMFDVMSDLSDVVLLSFAF